MVHRHPDATVFPVPVFYPRTSDEERDAYAIHHPARSWEEKEVGKRTAGGKPETREQSLQRELEKMRSFAYKLDEQLATFTSYRALRESFSPIIASIARLVRQWVDEFRHWHNAAPFVLLTGDVASCEAAVTVGARVAGRDGILVDRAVIPRPSRELLKEFI